MKTWLISPRDSLMIRDGRPADLGLAYCSLRFPWPSTAAGFARTRIGLNEQGRFTLSPEAAKQIAIKGCLLAETSAEGNLTFYAPAPLDALWCRHPNEQKQMHRYRLEPSTPPDGSHNDLASCSKLALLGVVGNERPKEKSISGPAFWEWDNLLTWLLAPPMQRDEMSEESWGLGDLVREGRTHVGIDPESQTAEDGRLFRTEMLRFIRKSGKLSPGSEYYRQFALAFACGDKGLSPGVGFFGGERRLSMLSESPQSLPTFPEERFPADASVLRVMLLTPGLFQQGFRPTDPPDATLIAAAVGRPEIISGWDMAAKPKPGPKETRRMAPAGSVYWFKLNAGVDPVEWAKKYWMQSMCDAKQDKLDGFGLCVTGVA